MGALAFRRTQKAECEPSGGSLPKEEISAASGPRTTFWLGVLSLCTYPALPVPSHTLFLHRNHPWFSTFQLRGLPAPKGRRQYVSHRKLSPVLSSEGAFLRAPWDLALDFPGPAPSQAGSAVSPYVTA